MTELPVLDLRRARVVVPAPGDGPGSWAGAATGRARHPGHGLAG
ncbi:hypothetical protein [Arsenicicoccus bolidensis]|nr:hypothetical protein [Arsenicicoccus bolidensis]